MLALRDKISLGKNLLCLYNDRLTSQSYMCKFCGWDEMQLPLLVTTLIHVCIVNQRKILGWSSWSTGSAQPSPVTNKQTLFSSRQIVVVTEKHCFEGWLAKTWPNSGRCDIWLGNKSAVHTNKQMTMTLLFTHSEEGNTAGLLSSLLFI